MMQQGSNMTFWKLLNMALAIVLPILILLAGMVIVWQGRNKIEGFILMAMTLYYFNLRTAIRNQATGAWWV